MNIFYASDAYECLISVPFNAAVATRFVNYLNTTFQFQSTSAYLKNPPIGYQQPSVDIFETLANIQQNVTTGSYANQYSFETDVQSLFYAVHDSHVDLSAGILSTFTFGSLYDIVSVSVDGVQAPSIYLAGSSSIRLLYSDL